MKKSDPFAIIYAQPWNWEIGLFDDVPTMVRCIKKHTGIKVNVDNSANGYALNTQNEKDGRNYFAIFLRDDSDFGTLVHECSHMADFIFDLAGVPVGIENTELRGYQMGQLVRDAGAAFGFDLTRRRT